MMTDYIQRLRQLQGVIWHGLYSSEATVTSTASAIEQLCLADDPIVLALNLAQTDIKPLNYLQRTYPHVDILRN